MTHATRILVVLSLMSVPAAVQTAATSDKPREEPPEYKPEGPWKQLGKSLWFDSKSRTLLIRAKVVLRDGPLEHLMCRRASKEHESILSTDAEPSQIHAGLLLIGAKPGAPVRFEPEFKPPAGSPIRIEIEWNEAGKAKKADARSWVKDDKTNKALDRDWVFAGSLFLDDPFTKKKYYAADDGDLFCVANFPASILDVPFRSSSDDTDRGYSAFTDHVPPMGTEASLLLRLAPDDVKR